ncbi:hypothetical protein [Alicyclobacillus macrosporangiidus]|uniref:hypothetical protein n=1 Tax=Alicyclobacillus macrosporangiidus TaxID=392015 RepID=UPI000A5D9623|nr:hypothetical protein [Alicyclobacillus macrosporangiidus]
MEKFFEASWDPRTGLALVRAGQTGGTELVRTRDGGATWETVHTALVVGGP